MIRSPKWLLHEARRVLLTGIALVGLAMHPLQLARADSAIPLLSGFDEARMANIVPGEIGSANIGELAKLLYRLDQLDDTSLEDLVSVITDAASTTTLGDVITVRGQVQEIRRIAVSDDLAEVLQRPQFYRVDIAVGEAGPVALMSLYVGSIPASITGGDQVTATGVIVAASDSGVRGMAAAKLRWTPAKFASVGMRLLAAEGIDIAAVMSLAKLNRQPLQAADNDTFYDMIAAAARVASSPSPPPIAEVIEPGTLLQTPDGWCGQWIRLNLESVRITRVAVTQPPRRRQLGGDEYFQIDAIGELGNVVIDLQRPQGGPVRFENRFPVSVVIRKLPPFLSTAMLDADGRPNGVALVSKRLAVDGFFYRLWSYENDRMNRGGAGSQIGPLVIASVLIDLEIPGRDPIGVSRIGYVAAAAVVLAVVLLWFWIRRNRRADTEARQSRQKLAEDDLAWLGDHVE